MSADYYEALGLSKGASLEDIKKAYRKLAREWHPDVAKDKPNAEQKFKEINEAYHILSDPQKKAQYDQFGHSAFQGGQQGGAGFNPFSGFGSQGQSGPFTWSYSTQGGGDSQYEDFGDPFDIFEQVFGYRGFGGTRKGRNIRYSLNIDFADSVKGMDETIKVDGHNLRVKVPPGVSDGTQIKFAGKGENPGRGVPAGDLYISINIKPSPNFGRQGRDTFSIQEISMAIAVLGGSINTAVVDPKSDTGFTTKKVKIPSGTQPGTQIRLRGQGMPIPNSLGRGDHYINIKVEIPKRLNRDQKRALEEYFI
ncbi:hypothetical protein A2982_00980 [candidate division WWE3 bacterium RIFCSPLOWO2_01_FULL_39_13]|uniref:J domain-containing protein n=1 Tax=candidate division WWE3 bacterium RIFCSPLOWO2_01_FULL_39_13 TaxID=1802624 RepID=A0A1F4V5D9_UNCKA|nr:MAG: hypothetical protein A2982_00980 [candidate division WWE3 bacterium RIFCSPLOWO2_01_FULL_39_13]